MNIKSQKICFILGCIVFILSLIILLVYPYKHSIWIIFSMSLFLFIFSKDYIKTLSNTNGDNNTLDNLDIYLTNSRAQSDNVLTNTELHDLANEVDFLRKRKDSLEREIYRRNIELSLAQEEEKKLDFRIKNKKSLLESDMQREIDVLKSRIETLKNEMSTQKEIKFKLVNEIEELKATKAILKENIENLKNEQFDLTQILDNKMHDLSIEYIDNLSSGVDFEKCFAQMLKKLNFTNVKVTSGSGDYGIDVIGYNDDILYGFQCKLYSKPVGNDAIQQAYSGKIHYKCNVAIVVTNNYFTEQAIKQAEETNVILWNRNTLIKKIKDINKLNK